MVGLPENLKSYSIKFVTRVVFEGEGGRGSGLNGGDGNLSQRRVSDIGVVVSTVVGVLIIAAAAAVGSWQQVTLFSGFLVGGQ